MLACRLIHRGCSDVSFVPALAWITWLGRGAFLRGLVELFRPQKRELRSRTQKVLGCRRLSNLPSPYFLKVDDFNGDEGRQLLLTLLYPRSRVFHPVLNQVTT